MKPKLSFLENKNGVYSWGAIVIFVVLPIAFMLTKEGIVIALFVGGVAVLLALFLFVSNFILRRRLRSTLVEYEHKLCLECRHPLIGLDSKDACPECGKRFEVQETQNEWSKSLYPRTFFKLPFWKRQFSREATSAQRSFDVTLGIVLPLICFVADPIVFRMSLSRGSGILHEWTYLVYSGVLIQLIMLYLWLVYGHKLKLARFFVGGGLLVGALAAAVIGLILLPFSVIGLIMIIGILGFTPWLTSFVYLRNGIRALGPDLNHVQGTEWKLNQRMAILVILGILFSAGLPVVVHFLFDTPPPPDTYFLD